MEVSPKPIKKLFFHQLWAQFHWPVADGSFSVSCSGCSRVYGKSASNMTDDEKNKDQRALKCLENDLDLDKEGEDKEVALLQKSIVATALKATVATTISSVATTLSLQWYHCIDRHSRPISTVMVTAMVQMMS
jgi:hypothetical protein